MGPNKPKVEASATRPEEAQLREQSIKACQRETRPAAPMTVMPFVLIVQLVMSGAIFALDGVLKAVSGITISRWGLDAICASAHSNDMLEVLVGSAERLEEMAPTTGNLVSIWLTLLGFSAIYVVLSVVALSFVDEY